MKRIHTTQNNNTKKTTLLRSKFREWKIENKQKTEEIEQQHMGEANKTAFSIL